ncbi:MAG: CRISPR-associated protein Cas4 [Clostridia bacterium]
MKKITGTIYAYSFLCDRKMWLYANDISMESENENVKLGKSIEENYYKRESKNILIDDTINIDYIKNNIIFEIKKSSKEKQMGINQIKFYLYNLRLKGIENKHGILSIPTERYTEEVYLQEEDVIIINNNIEKIKSIINDTTTMPKSVEKNICKQCAYYELCYI